MVPPTIAKRIQAQNGSFQLWLDGGKLLRDVDEEAIPRTEAWFRQLSRMKVFDNLISNWDRSPKNIMVDDEWNVVLIDHSQAFLSHKRLDEDPDKLPVKFDREMVEKLEGLKLEVLKLRFGRLLLESQVEAIIARRDALLELIERLVKERGEAAVFY